MEIVLLPALLGLLIKISFLIILIKNKATKSLISLVLILALHNLCEFGALMSWIYVGASDLGIRSYYATTFILLGAALCYSIDLSKLKPLKKLSEHILFYSFGLALIVLFTDIIVAGSAELANYSITAIKGNHYYLFQVWAMLCLISTFSILFLSYLKSDQADVRINCCYILFAFFPITIISISIIILMSLGFNINASVIMPFATTIFVALISKTKESHYLYDMRQRVPFSKQWHLSRKLKDISNKYMLGDIALNEAIQQSEKLFLEYSIDEHNGNIKKTAEATGIPRSTLYHKIKK